MTLTPHAEKIIIPNPIVESVEISEPLLTVIDPEGIREQLQDESSLKIGGGYENMALSAMDFICSQVRSALMYPVKEKDRDDFKKFDITLPVPLSELMDRQIADCFGFTIVASECIDEAGIDHWMGFANGHSVLLLPSEKSQRLHLIDPLSKVLGQNLQHSIASGSTITEDMAAHGRSAAELNTLSIASRARGSDLKLLDEHPWLVFNRGGGQGGIKPSDYVGSTESSEFHSSRLKILMSIFRPAEGRQVLQDYNAFQLAYNKGDYIAAAARVQSMRGSFPEIDARRLHTEIKRIVLELGRADRVAFAKRVIDSYFESFVLIQSDSRFKVANGDVLRVLAREGHDLDAADMAIDRYGEALDRTRFPSAYRESTQAKLEKTVRLRDQLLAQA